MNTKTRNFIISGGLIILSILITILIKYVDVSTIGPNDSSVGFATLNNLIFKVIGVNMIWYHITNWLGFVAIIISFLYVIIGLVQLIKRKSIFKVDREILFTGIFYIVLISIYVLFEVYIVNYRPILIDGCLEASYPSSHTLITICLCGSSILLNKKLFNNVKVTKILNIILLFVVLITVFGRIISGVHWFSDIISGIIISSALLMSYYTVLNIKFKID